MEKLFKSLAITLLASLLLPASAWASSKAEACLKYQKEYGWSDGYKVEGTLIGGAELSAKVGDYTRFRSFSTYFVVFWDKDQASIFELPGTSFGAVPIFEAEVVDQRNKTWSIKAGHTFCY